MAAILYHKLILAIGERVSLTDKYQLHSPANESAGASDQSIGGQQRSTGRPVTVHLLSGSYNPENQALLREIAGLPPEYKACFLETGDHKGSPFVVTDALSGAPPFRKWFTDLQAKRNAAGSSGLPDLMQVRAWQIPVIVSSQTPAEQAKRPVIDVGDVTQLIQSPAPPPQTPPAGPGEFTMLFQTPQVPEKAPPVPLAQEPGEFTRLFQVPSAPPPPPAPAAPNPDATLLFQAPPKPPPAPGPGEFTRMFAPAPKPAPVVESPALDDFPLTPQKAPDTAQPGEFTRMMESPLARAGLKPQKYSAPTTPEPRLGDAHEFTRMLESPLSSQPEVPSKPSPAQQGKPSGEATRAFRVPEAPPALAPEPADTPPQGPSEFTQMFRAPAKEPEPKPDKPVVKPPRVIARKKKNSGYLKWILAASAVLLIIALIVFFAVRD